MTTKRLAVHAFLLLTASARWREQIDTLSSTEARSFSKAPTLSCYKTTMAVSIDSLRSRACNEKSL